MLSARSFWCCLVVGSRVPTPLNRSSDAAESADGVIVNAGAWAHYNYAIRDALELVTAPIVEVHLSDVDRREEWRRLSVISDLAAERIVGKGQEGYRLALEYLVGAAA